MRVQSAVCGYALTGSGPRPSVEPAVAAHLMLASASMDSCSGSRASARDSLASERLWSTLIA
jgi:hypothetical protein